jgi:5-methylcytosine-specific restriction endonuclease McrA
LPHAYGGTDDPDNLVAACHFCNLKASDRVFDSFEAKHEFLQAFLPEKIRRMRRKICICADCGELFQWRQRGATAVLCEICARRDNEREIPRPFARLGPVDLIP